MDEAETGRESYIPALILALFAITVWGGTPIATKVAVEAISPLAVTLWRTLLAAVIAGVLAMLWRPMLPRSRRSQICTLLSAGMGYIAFPWLLALGLQTASAGIAALLIALAPVFTGVLTLALGRIRVNVFWVVGTCLAVLGSTVLLGFDVAEVGRDRLSGNLLVLLAVMAAAIGYVSGAEAARETGALAVAIWGHLATVPLFLLFVGSGIQSLLDAGFVPLAWSSIVYLAALSSLGAYIAWYGALARRPAISQVQFLQGAIGVLLAVVFLREPLEAVTVGAAVMVILGVVVTQRAVRPAKGRNAPSSEELGS